MKNALEYLALGTKFNGIVRWTRNLNYNLKQNLILTK